MKHYGFILAGCVLIFPVVPGAWAFDLSGNIATHTRLIDRGLSLSGDDPAVSGALYGELGKGFYSGVNIARVDDLRGNDLRLGGVIGKTFTLHAYELDISASLDSFVGEDATLYPEIDARLSRDLGLFYAAIGLSYAPDGRWTARDRHTLYSYVEAEVPIPTVPWLVATAHLGHEAVENASDKTDWGVGMAAGFRSFALSVSYEDSSRRSFRGGSRLVAALRYYF